MHCFSWMMNSWNIFLVQPSAQVLNNIHFRWMQVYPRGTHSTVHKRITWLVSASNPDQSSTVYAGKWWSTVAGHCGLCWVWICWYITCNACPRLLEPVILFCTAMVLDLHRSVPGQDDEEGSSGRAEELWETSQPESLLSSFPCGCAIPHALLVRQHQRVILQSHFRTA